MERNAWYVTTETLRSERDDRTRYAPMPGKASKQADTQAGTLLTGNPSKPGSQARKRGEGDPMPRTQRPEPEFWNTTPGIR